MFRQIIEQPASRLPGMAADLNPILSGDAYLHGQSFRPNRSCRKTVSSGIRRIGPGSDATFRQFAAFDKAQPSRKAVSVTGQPRVALCGDSLRRFTLPFPWQ
jgi:hypothetical protein